MVTLILDRLKVTQSSMILDFRIFFFFLQRISILECNKKYFT